MIAKERYLFLAQRITAMILGPLVMIHLGLILYAMNNGLSGAEILNRTQGNLLWGAFYSLFVIAAAIHGPIGIRNILREWSSMTKPAIDILAIAFSALLLVLGLRAVAAVI